MLKTWLRVRFTRSSSSPALSSYRIEGHATARVEAPCRYNWSQLFHQSWAGYVPDDGVDPACAALDYVRGSGRELQTEWAMSNNFAFGGINTSLVLRRWR